MLDKKIVKNILLEVEAGYYNYEKYLNEVIERVLNNKDFKYLIARENEYLVLYKYDEDEYIQWLYENYDFFNNKLLSALKVKYDTIYKYVQKNYIDYYVEENILNFINVSKFRKMLYKNEKSILNITLNTIYLNIRNYSNNEYLVNEYNLNKKLYSELKKIQKGF
jgi:hypothetical protein